MPTDKPDFFYGENRAHAHHLNRGALTPKGFKHLLSCIDAMLEVCGDNVELALDCGPGMVISDAIRLAKAVEWKNVAWLEDMLTGDYVPYTLAQNYREVTQSTSTRIHTGEQIFLRQNFVELIENRCLDVLGPDPCDVGGIAELKWIAEYADLHDILMAPHGTIDGLFGAIISISFSLFPYVYVLTRASFYHQSNNLIEVSKNLGLSARESFFKIILPSARPAIVVGLSLVAMECLSDFGTVSFFSVSTLTTGIYNSWLAFDDLNTANQLSFVLLMIILIVFCFESYSRKGARYHHVSQGFKKVPKIKLKKSVSLATTTFLSLLFFLSFILTLILQFNSV